MVLHTVPNGHMMVNQKSAEQLKAVVKAESPHAKQEFNTGTAQWPSLGGFIQGRPGGLVRLTPSHRHSPVSGQASPRVDHQFGRQREREASCDEHGQEIKRCRVGNSTHTLQSQMQSHLLSPRAIASPGAPPPSPIHFIVSSPKLGESHGMGNGHAAQVALPPRLSPPVSSNPLDVPSPLGLVLKKTPSLLDLISMKLAQTSGDHNGGNSIDGSSQEGGAKKCLVPTVTPQDKLKASNFPASSLKIGTWERLSRYEGDLVGKCYYAKRKLVWEVLENGLKSKIEIQWSDISAMKASYPDNLPGTLDIEVSRPPLFFRETNPQPRKHTLWQATSDFTGGQATICKRHSLQFPEGVLNRHFEKLIQCDSRLKALSEGTPLSTGPVSDYEHNWFYNGNVSSAHSHQPIHHPLGRHNSFHEGPSNHSPPLVLSHMQGLQSGRSLPNGKLLIEAKSEVGEMNVPNNNSSSTAGGAGSHRGGEASKDIGGEDLQSHRNINEYDHLDLEYQNGTRMGIHDLVDMKPAPHELVPVGAQNGALQHPSTHMRLEDIAQVLLGDPSSSQNEPPMMFHSDYGQMPPSTSGGDLSQQAFVSQRSALQNANQGYPPFGSNGGDGHGEHQRDEFGDPTSLPEIMHQDLSSSTLLSPSNRQGSTSDFELISFPRVVSLPQIFGAPPQDPIPGGRYDSTYMSPTYYNSEKLR